MPAMLSVAANCEPRKWKSTAPANEVRHQPAGGVAADRPERDEAQVEQAGVADDDVQAERAHHLDQRLVDRTAAAASRATKSCSAVGTAPRK